MQDRNTCGLCDVEILESESYLEIKEHGVIPSREHSGPQCYHCSCFMDLVNINQGVVAKQDIMRGNVKRITTGDNKLVLGDKAISDFKG